MGQQWGTTVRGGRTVRKAMQGKNNLPDIGGIGNEREQAGGGGSSTGTRSRVRIDGTYGVKFFETDTECRFCGGLAEGVYYVPLTALSSGSEGSRYYPMFRSHADKAERDTGFDRESEQWRTFQQDDD